jgi:hypothetical protein
LLRQADASARERFECFGCRRRLVAHLKDDLRARHFAHYRADDCVGYETYLHNAREDRRRDPAQWPGLAVSTCPKATGLRGYLPDRDIGGNGADIPISRDNPIDTPTPHRLSVELHGS